MFLWECAQFKELSAFITFSQLLLFTPSSRCQILFRRAFFLFFPPNNFPGQLINFFGGGGALADGICVLGGWGGGGESHFVI